MENLKKINTLWDDSPIDVSAEVNFIWSIANKLRGPYQSDKYKDVIIPMTIIRRFECALEDTKDAVVDKFKKMPTLYHNGYQHNSNRNIADTHGKIVCPYLWNMAYC